jgi:hypothetical protein
MSAITILSHQLAASILFLYAVVAVVFTTTRKPPQRVPLTHFDVDLKHCTVDELEYMLGLLLVSAPGLTLSEQEINRFWSIMQELDQRGALHG